MRTLSIVQKLTQDSTRSKISVSIPQDTLDRVDSLAGATGASRSHTVSVLLLEALKLIEEGMEEEALVAEVK